MGGGGVITFLEQPNGDVQLDGVAFHDWIDYNGVAFSIQLPEWGRTVSDFGVTQFFIFTRVSSEVS